MRIGLSNLATRNRLRSQSLAAQVTDGRVRASSLVFRESEAVVDVPIDDPKRPWFSNTTTEAEKEPMMPQYV